MLTLENISVHAGNFHLRNICFTVERGDYFVILGPSGVGKSVLLETIAGMRQPDSGILRLRGRDVTAERIQNRNISIVYQDADLFPHLSIFENIAYPLRSRRQKNIKDKVLQAAALTGIDDKLDRKPGTLSGGEYQRVALARSIAADSDIVLLDEPLSSVDSLARNELQALLRKINRNGMTIIHVTHDYEEAISVAKRIGIMEEGELVHIDTPEEIFRHPKSEFVAHFVGVKNFLRGTLQKGAQGDLKTFESNGMTIYALTDVSDGGAFLMIRPDEITLSNSSQSSSSRNQFKGPIIDIAPARLGIEVRVDIGCEFVVLISVESRTSMDLDIGKLVWINFKASSCKLYKSGGNGK